MHCDPHAIIDLAALRHNLGVARRAAPNSRVMAVIKANAYGHGAPRVARALGDADALGVARVSEGVRLRREGIRQPVVVLEGCCDSAALAAAAASDLQIAIHTPEQLQLLRQCPPARPLACWLKIDSGMHRLGFPPAEAAAAFHELRASPGVGEVRLMTHLACADDRADPATEGQLARFLPLLRELGTEGSAANSGGLLGWPQARLDWVRPGILLYGAAPFADASGPELGLRPVMTLRSRLIAVRRFGAGEPIGYGATWRCPEAMPIGVVAIGYGDGYPRHARAGTPVLLHGRRAPLVGRVSMDMITIDLRHHPQAAIGDAVTLWGEGLPAESVAGPADTIPYQLFCGVTSRVALQERE
jgi:alanine racemase